MTPDVIIDILCCALNGIVAILTAISAKMSHEVDKEYNSKLN